MRRHVTETDYGTNVIVTDEGMPPGQTLLLLADTDEDGGGTLGQVRLTEAERARLVEQLTEMAPRPGIMATSLQPGDVLLDGDQVVYTLVNRTFDVTDPVDGAVLVRWFVRYRDGGPAVRQWVADVLTPLVRP